MKYLPELDSLCNGRAGELVELLYTRATAISLAFGLLLVVLVRTWIPYESVFRENDVVLVANDPYHFRYWVDTLLASDLQPYYLSDLAALPEEMLEWDVLFIVTMWAVSVLLGGDPTTAAAVLAWYPVVAAVVMALFVYWIAVMLTADRRVGVLSVVLLALTPVHVYRTMLGFGDHHAFTNFLVIVTAAALIRLATLERVGPERTVVDKTAFWGATVGLGVAVAAQVLSWRGGPLMLVPIGGYVLLSATSCVRAGENPVREHAGVIVGLGIASILGAGAFLGLGWGEAYRGLAPLLLLALVLGVFVGANLISLLDLSWQWTVLTGIGAAGALVGLLWVGPQWVRGPLDTIVGFWRGRVPNPRVGPGEGASLIGSPEVPFLMFGLLLFVALPVIGWVTVAIVRNHRPAWVVLWVYTLWFFVLSLGLIRWANQLSMFIAVLAAIGLLYVAAEAGYVQQLALFDDSTRETTDVRSVELSSSLSLLRAGGAVMVLVVLVMAIGFVFVPGTMAIGTFDDTEYETATWMANYSDEQELEYPENYVLSDHRTFRFYNYFVSGESASESRFYDRSFIVSTEPKAWDYERLGSRFVVTQDIDGEYPTDSMQARLHDRYGSGGDGVSGLAHFRLVHVSDDKSRNVFTVVEGATITGETTPESTVEVRTTVSVDGTEFTYQRTVETNSTGTYEVTVPYPGTYSVDSAEVEITGQDVLDGRNVCNESE